MVDRQQGDLPCPVTGDMHVVQAYPAWKGERPTWRHICSYCGDRWDTDRADHSDGSQRGTG